MRRPSKRSTSSPIYYQLRTDPWPFHERYSDAAEDVEAVLLKACCGQGLDWGSVSTLRFERGDFARYLRPRVCRGACGVRYKVEQINIYKLLPNLSREMTLTRGRLGTSGEGILVASVSPGGSSSLPNALDIRENQ